MDIDQSLLLVENLINDVFSGNEICADNSLSVYTCADSNVVIDEEICADSNVVVDEEICADSDSNSCNETYDSDYHLSDADSADSDIDSNSGNDACADSGSFLISSNADSESDTENLMNAANDVAFSKVSKKKARNEGKPYISTSGKLIPARAARKLEPCRKKCAQKISYKQQQKINKHYWATGSYSLRRAIVAGLIEVVETKTIKRTKSETNPRRRDHSYNYFLEIKNIKISVCQKCFRYTLCESEQFIKTVVKKKLEEGTGYTDMRGKHKNPKKMPLEKENEILSFIQSIPSYESHYTRRDTSKRYLPSDLSVAELHRMYCEKYNHSVSLSEFAKLFNTLNFKFKKPKLDTCHKCDLFNCKLQVATPEELDTIKLEQAEHHNQAQLAYDCKKADKEKALDDTSLKVFCFDLQQCLPTPLLRTSISFYKRPLWTFNLTVHDLVSNQPTCYMWHEAVAKRGGNEIASCIFNHLLNIDSNTKHAIFYSDCCPGQNKNTYVATMFAVFTQFKNNVSIIDHKFMVPGHTHMECDSDHALIEKKKKNTSIKIHHPRDWYLFIRTIGVKKKYIVNEMNQSDMFDFGNAAKNLFTWRKVDDNGQKYSWHSMKWLRFTKQFGKIYFKTSLSEEEPFKFINISKRGINSVKGEDIKHCYNAPIKINVNKKKDLIDMLPLVDDIYKKFYENLQTEEMLDYHPDLTEYDEADDNT